MARPVAPGPIVIPNCLQVRLIWTQANRTLHNIVHGNWTTVGPIDPALVETLFTGFKTQFTSSGWAGMVNTGTSFAGVGLRDLRNANQIEYLSSSAPIFGSDASGDLVASNATVVTLKTNQSGRGFRGRVYLGGLGQIVRNDAFSFTGAAGTAAINFVTGLNTVMTSNGLPLCIGQRALLAGTDSHGNPLPARAANTVQVTSVVVVDHRFDSQRRRLGR
jgi:hypothetical protein